MHGLPASTVFSGSRSRPAPFLAVPLASTAHPSCVLQSCLAGGAAEPTPRAPQPRLARPRWPGASLRLGTGPCFGNLEKESDGERRRRRERVFVGERSECACAGCPWRWHSTIGRGGNRMSRFITITRRRRIATATGRARYQQTPGALFICRGGGCWYALWVYGYRWGTFHPE